MDYGHRAPGKIIVELTPEANAIVPEVLPDLLSTVRLFDEVEDAEGVDMELTASMRATYLLRLPDETDLDAAMEILKVIPGVQFVEPVMMVDLDATPNDMKFASQWGLTAIRAPLAWDRQKGSSDVSIVVLDTGCDQNHPDLSPRLAKGWDFCEDPTPPPGFVREGDYTAPDDDPQDELGHGTFVAGIIGAETNNGVGMAGVTWNGAIFAARIAARSHNIDNPAEIRPAGSSEEAARAIAWAAPFAHVVNMSVSTADTRHLRQAVAYALQRSTTLVASMGNDEMELAKYPAAYPGVIAVGAVDQTLERWVDRVGVGSNTGSHISVCAPGAEIFSLQLFSTFGSPKYATNSGTSAAAPFVSGVAALLYSCSGVLAPDQIKQIIEETANKAVRPTTGGYHGPWPNHLFGHGVVDAKAAVDRVLDGPIPNAVSPAPEPDWRGFPF